MTTQPERISLDDLDTLYEQLEQADLDAEQQARHFRTICGERESYRQAWKHEQKHRAIAEARVRELTADVARLAAGQCTDQRAMCEQHHAPPVAGCPYPRCRAARAAGRAATA
ncbi:hypothetical protein [Streptomyces anulatus]|uniref:hypothetical protein n=1 Tax=Streptomyces anulatus TaxID=1892 RepID=UPI002E10B3CE|nr:hypothetical protein OG557_13555 [Streptomyces anulatus]